ncbi:AAA ATPase-like domain-containing protein [Desulfonema limicola]|uniref:AAA ATPase-like domain-containing protein n=1 Tax=Desulfonema limicola TaxID=45656 RepID=A0A975B7C1_9BACT|nr:AAA family ATPase [Desulfonema limicola]QTA80161.1 AAA ATPase-like domain-containing protein [Desulfonema limicola]
MLKKELIRRNPLKLMGYEAEDILGPGEFGALTARAGVGKTAFLVQLAIDKLLRDRTVLHISLNEPVEKVCLWYEEVFRNLAFQSNIKKLDLFWETILPNRFIMTFKAETFSVAILKERLADLTEQGIFFPQMIIIDSFPFDKTQMDAVDELKKLAKDHSVAVWCAVKTHRHKEPGPDGMPYPLYDIAKYFEVIFELQPDEKNIKVKALKGGPDSNAADLIVDPSTMLVQDNTRSA